MKIWRRGSFRIPPIYIRVCVHVGDRGLAGCADRGIWRHAGDHGLVIVSKDEDFRRLGVLHGAPPKVIWIRLGNCSTADIIRLLRERPSEIDLFMGDEESTFLALA